MSRTCGFVTGLLSRGSSASALCCYRKGSGEGGEGKRNVLTAARSLSHARLASVLKRGSTPPTRGAGGGGAGAK